MLRILAASLCLCTAMGGSAALADLPQLTSTAQLQKLAGLDLSVAYAIHLQGDVMWADSSGRKIALRDESGLALLSVELRDQVIWPANACGFPGGLAGCAATVGRWHAPAVLELGYAHPYAKSGTLRIKLGIHYLASRPNPRRQGA